MKNFYVYIITDINTNEFYIGSRGFDGLPETDKYLGSPYIWKPNIKNLSKRIIECNFPSMDDAIKYERELILENIDNPLNRNYSVPHHRFNRSGLITVKNKNGKVLSISKDDPLFGKEFFGITKGMVLVKDSSGNKMLVSINDDRYINGDLVSNNKGLILGENHQNYGRRYINNGHKQKLINKEELDTYIKNGWILGTLQKNKTTNSSHCDTTWVYKDSINKRLKSSELDYYLKNGWQIGRIFIKKYKRRK